MGRPSDIKRRARRPGKRERVRVKKSRRSVTFGLVPGAGTYELKSGRKKWVEFQRSRRNPFAWGRNLLAHHAGEPHPESGEQTPQDQDQGEPVSSPVRPKQ